jgi:hypothetical protein
MGGRSPLAISGFGYPVSHFSVSMIGIHHVYGVLLRVATDINLHQPITALPVNEQHAREMLNRTRVWLNCFNLDRSTGSEYGKPPIIKNTDYVANHSESWWSSSPYNLPHFDIHICAYNAELKVMARFTEKIYSDPHHMIGLNKVCLCTESLSSSRRSDYCLYRTLTLRRSPARRTTSLRSWATNGSLGLTRRTRRIHRTASGRVC